LLPAVAAVILAAIAGAAVAQPPLPATEKIEWTWSDRPEKPVAELPNILLVGDSITRGYYPAVAAELKGFANVYLFASSACSGDPRLPGQLRTYFKMMGVTFAAVHFNNGMHGWDYTEAQYRAAFPDLLHSVKALAPARNSLIWATITPVQLHAFNGATNERIDDRNRIALAQIRAAGIQVDDQHELMEKHLDTYQDTVHFGPTGTALMGDQAAKTIREALHLEAAPR